MVIMDRILDRPMEKVGFCCLQILDTMFADDIALLASLNGDVCLFLELFKAEHEVEHWRLESQGMRTLSLKEFSCQAKEYLKERLFWWGLDKIPERQKDKDKMCL